MRFILATVTKLLRHMLPIVGLLLAIGSASGQSGETFDAFLAGLWKDAAAQGISRATFDLAFAGVTPDARVLGAMQHAPEYGKPFGAYVESIVSPSRVAIGTRKSAQWADMLRRIETKYGVPASILVSIWGIESSFGDSADRWDVFRCIATLAQAKIQQPYFRDELISALKILQSHAIARPQLLGSYAGAMGQAQFMPSSYLKYAVDFDGDGRADIWTSVPDVLASIANYLRQFGWQPGLPWGFEVLAPLKFDYRVSRGSFREWHARGFERLDGFEIMQHASVVAGVVHGGIEPAVHLLDEPLGPRARVVVHVPVERLGELQALRHVEPKRVDVGDEHQQSGHALAGFDDTELGSLLDRVDRVASGVGEPDHLGLGGLRLQQE